MGATALLRLYTGLLDLLAPNIQLSGDKTIERMRAKSDRMSEAILTGLNSTERQQLAAMLEVVKTNLLNFKELPKE